MIPQTHSFSTTAISKTICVQCLRILPCVDQEMVSTHHMIYEKAETTVRETANYLFKT